MGVVVVQERGRGAGPMVKTLMEGQQRRLITARRRCWSEGGPGRMVHVQEEGIMNTHADNHTQSSVYTPVSRVGRESLRVVTTAGQIRQIYLQKQKIG